MRSSPRCASVLLAAGLTAAAAIGAVVAAPVAVGAAPVAGAAARPASRAGSGVAAWGQRGPAARALPEQVYAPYFETWTKRAISTEAARSGARYFTLAFLQAPRRGSCKLAWNGMRSQLVRPGGRYVADIARLRAMGGDVVPSFGGYSADHDGTEIADSCHSVPKIARAYESVVTTYGVTRLDMDVEANSLRDQAGLTRRSEALAMLQRWAAARHRTVQIVLTLGVEPWGLPANCLAVLKNAVAHGVRVSAVNILAFDYYNAYSKTPDDMGTEAISALRHTHRQLARLYPGASAGRLWAREGITLLPGIDDYPKRTEITYPSEAQDVEYFAVAHHLPLISIWAIQRDNGGCPGRIDSNSCSGIQQPTWAFSHLLEGYTRR